MMDFETALEAWNTAIADKNRFFESTLGQSDTATNLAMWLTELTDIKTRLTDSAATAAALMPSDMRLNFVNIAEQVLASTEASLHALRTQLSVMN